MHRKDECMSYLHSTHVGCLIANSIGGKIGAGYQSEVEKFRRHNGVEWTSSRLKSVWNAALHLRNGDRNLAQQIYQDNSIAYHSGSMTPKGNVGAAVRQFLRCSQPAALRRWSALLRYYTGFTIREVTKRQVRKVLSSIQGDSTASTEAEHIRTRVLEEWNHFLSSVKKKPGPKPGTRWVNSLKGSTMYYSPDVPRGIREVYYGPLLNSLHSTQYVPDSIRDRLRGSVSPDVLSYLGSSKDDFVGRITLLQEGGAKVRPIATPNGWSQLAFRPLHSILEQYSEYCPESCVSDQLKGVRKAISVLQEGHEVHSVDLSSATDRLPRNLQCDMLKASDLSDYADALDEISSKPWRLDTPTGTRSVSYTVGQPMGLYGSFPLLNLTNLMIARSAEREVTGKINPGETFHVIGDDIVFYDHQVCRQYMSDMSDLGVSISMDKTFSGKVAQFAGFVIIPSSNGVTAFRPYKHPDGKVITNPIQFLHALGKHVQRLPRRKWWERIYSAFTSTFSHRDLDLSPDIWVKDAEVPSPRHVDQSWIASAVNKVSRLRNPNPTLEYHTWWDRIFFKNAIGEGMYSLFNLEQESQYSIPQDTLMDTHRSRELDPIRRVEKSVTSDPLIREALLRSYGVESPNVVPQYYEITIKEFTRTRRLADGRVVTSIVAQHQRRYPTR